MPSLYPAIGARSEYRTTEPVFTPGTVAFDKANRSYVYVGPSANAITANSSCTVTGAFAVNNTAGSYTADAAFATGEYGWVRKTTSPF